MSKLTEVQKKIWNNGAPLAKKMMVAAIICQFISGLTEGYGAFKYFDQIIGSFTIDTNSYYIIVYGSLFVLFILSLLSARQSKEHTLPKIILIVALMLAFPRFSLLIAISLCFASILELIIKEGVWYVSNSFLQWNFDTAGGFNLFIASIVTICFIGYSVFVSKEAISTTFSANPIQPTLISKEQIKADKETAIANAKSYYNKDYEVISKNHDQAIDKQNEYYDQKVKEKETEIALWKRKGASTYRSKINKLERQIASIEQDRAKSLLSVDTQFKTEEKQLREKRDQVIVEANTRYNDRESEIDADNKNIKENTANWSAVFGGVIKTIATMSVIVAVLCYVWVAVFFHRCGIYYSYSPTSEFFEGALGGYLVELYEYHFLFSLRKWRNSLRDKMGKVDQLKQKNTSTLVFGDKNKQNVELLRQEPTSKKESSSSSSSTAKSVEGTVEKDNKELSKKTVSKPSKTVEKTVEKDSAKSVEGTVEKDNKELSKKTVSKPSKKTVSKPSKKTVKKAAKSVVTRKDTLLSIEDNGNGFYTVYNKESDSKVEKVELIKKGDVLHADVNGEWRNASWINKSLKDRQSKLKNPKPGRKNSTNEYWVEYFELCLFAFEMVKQQKVLNSSIKVERA